MRLLSAILVACYCQLSDMSCWIRDIELDLFSHISYKEVITTAVWDFLFRIIGLLTMYNFSFSSYFYAKKKKTVDKRARENTKGKPMASLTSLQLCNTGFPCASKQCMFQTHFIQSYKYMSKTYSSSPSGQLCSNQCHISAIHFTYSLKPIWLWEILKQRTKYRYLPAILL